MDRPVIGLEMDAATDEKHVSRCMLRMNYLEAVIDAGGLPLLIPPLPQQTKTYLNMCHGLILTGGDDPRTEPFGQPTHPLARPIEPARQATILALLDAVKSRPAMPVLGICLGMQMMSLHAGGRLDQYLPEMLSTAAAHQGCKPHDIQFTSSAGVLAQTSSNDDRMQVISAHQQAVADAGSLRVAARATDGVIEAIDDPARQFYAGVQWHPERGDQGPLSLGLLKRFVDACRHASPAGQAAAPPPPAPHRQN